MTVTEGDRFKSLLTEKNYHLKLIKDYSAVLESEDGSSQVLTDEENLYLFYEKILNGDGRVR
jgi:hypothetical protein